MNFNLNPKRLLLITIMLLSFCYCILFVFQNFDYPLWYAMEEDNSLGEVEKSLVNNYEDVGLIGGEPEFASRILQSNREIVWISDEVMLSIFTTNVFSDGVNNLDVSSSEMPLFSDTEDTDVKNFTSDFAEELFRLSDATQAYHTALGEQACQLNSIKVARPELSGHLTALGTALNDYSEWLRGNNISLQRSASCINESLEAQAYLVLVVMTDNLMYEFTEVGVPEIGCVAIRDWCVSGQSDLENFPQEYREFVTDELFQKVLTYTDLVVDINEKLAGSVGSDITILNVHELLVEYRKASQILTDTLNTVPRGQGREELYSFLSKMSHLEVKRAAVGSNKGLRTCYKDIEGLLEERAYIRNTFIEVLVNIVGQMDVAIGATDIDAGGAEYGTPKVEVETESFAEELIEQSISEISDCVVNINLNRDVVLGKDRSVIVATFQEIPCEGGTETVIMFEKLSPEDYNLRPKGAHLRLKGEHLMENGGNSFNLWDSLRGLWTTVYNFFR